MSCPQSRPQADTCHLLDLHRCARNASAAAAELLVDAGADLDAQDSAGATALHAACAASNLLVVVELLKAGAARLLPDAKGRLPQQLARFPWEHATDSAFLTEEGEPAEVAGGAHDGEGPRQRLVVAVHCKVDALAVAALGELRRALAPAGVIVQASGYTPLAGQPPRASALWDAAAQGASALLAVCSPGFGAEGSAEAAQYADAVNTWDLPVIAVRVAGDYPPFAASDAIFSQMQCLAPVDMVGEHFDAIGVEEVAERVKDFTDYEDALRSGALSSGQCQVFLSSGTEAAEAAQSAHLALTKVHHLGVFGGRAMRRVGDGDDVAAAIEACKLFIIVATPEYGSPT